MTGRDLIIYILENNLEDEPIVQDGKFIGFVTVMEVAEKMNVGVATVLAWVAEGLLSYVIAGNTIYIPADFKSPLENTL